MLKSYENVGFKGRGPLQSFTLGYSSFLESSSENQGMNGYYGWGTEMFLLRVKWETQEQTKQVRGALLLALLTQTVLGEPQRCSSERICHCVRICHRNPDFAQHR